MHIDPHVHCRDWNQSYKATIKSVTTLARSQGVKAIFDMPNTDPQITTRELVERRIKTAQEEGCLEGYYLYIGMTAEPNQIKEAVETVKTNPRVVGIKMYAGKSVGNLAITDENIQREIYSQLSKLGYDGVLIVHCEKESLFKTNLWNPAEPSSWNLARPIKAEVASVKDQINFARETNFQGHLHITHITSPEAVDLVNNAKRYLRITCGATTHHLKLSTSDMVGKEGLMLKVNPPLRDSQTVKTLRAYLKSGKIDWIETDHAPHTEKEKLVDYMSGIPSLESYSRFLDELKRDGFTEQQIKDLTYTNIKKVFTKVRDV